MKRLIFILAAMSICLAISGQTTKVRGRVVDASDEQGIAYAAVFFSGTTVGTTTDADGNFSLTTRDTSLTALQVQILGYETEQTNIKSGAFNDVKILLRAFDTQLSAVTVKADNKKARRLLQNIDKHRDRNNPELRPGYNCDVYSRLELDITHPREQLKGKILKKNWGFIFDYIDTSDVSGVPYLPVMINETVSKRYHCNNPEVDREIITATRLSGAEPEGNLASQFTGSMHLKNNFYSQFINVFNVEFPSPINSSGLLFYNYFIIDSLNIDGRKTLQVRFHPKKSISTPAFDGEMYVDAEEFALKSIKAKMVKGQNVNWVRDMVLEASYQRMADSSWFYKSDRFYADFSVFLSDSTKVLSFIGNRALEFSNPVFEKQVVGAKETVVTVKDDAGFYDEEYWSLARPYPLSEKEKNIYAMVERIQDTKLYTTLYDIVYTLINSYWEIGKIGLGPYGSIISFNPLEGFRLRMGIRTSVDWSRKDRITAYGAYSFKDLKPKGGFTWEHLFSKEPNHKLTVDAHFDTYQVGSGSAKFGDILSSLMGGGTGGKPCYVAEGSAMYEHEVNGSFNTQADATYRHYFTSEYVPMMLPDGSLIKDMPTVTGHLQFRWSHDETVNRGHFIKSYVHTQFPIVTLDLTGGMGWIGERYAYFKPELSFNWKLPVPPIGNSMIYFSAGAVIGQVPYHMLHVHEGNATWKLDKWAFNTMNFYEFASDVWATGMIEHNFMGFFLGKIPLLKKLQIREVAFVRATWGNLSERNNGTLPEGAFTQEGWNKNLRTDALMWFPQGMKPLGNVPFVEAGFGLTNICRLLRVDFIWRCTHRNDEQTGDARKFAVTLGLELNF